MQILNIILKNIKSHRDTRLKFVPGINVLSGANGVGKSTIFEAVGYALFGVNASDFVGKIDRFVTWGTKRGEISVTFLTNEGDRYRVSRGVGAGSKWLLAAEQNGDFEVEEHAGVSETEARIKELLHLDNGRSLADQFKLVIGPFQNDFLGPFVVKGPKQRQEAFDEILGIDAWRKTFKGTSAMLSAVKTKIELLSMDISGKQERLAVLPEKKKQLREVKQERGVLKKKLANKRKTKKKTEKQFVDLNGREKKIDSSRVEIQVIENRISDGKGKITHQENRVKESEQAHEIIKKTTTAKQGFETAEKRLAKLRQQEHERRVVEKDIVGLERQSTQIGRDFAHEQHEVGSIEKQLNKEHHQLTKQRKKLVADQELVNVAARLPQLQRDIEKLRLAHGLLEGRQAGLQEGKEKLSEGVCPFFKESCQNIGDQAPKDLFSEGLATLDQEKCRIMLQIEALNKELNQAVKAQEQLNILKTRDEEVEKQLERLKDRQQKNKKRKKGLELIQKQQVAAEKKVSIRKKDLEPFQDLDSKIKRQEQQRTKHQAGRDDYLANLKAADDLNNRRQELKTMVTLMAALQQTLAVDQKKLEKLQKEYDADHHAEIRVTRDKLVADIATFKEQLENLGKEQLRLEEEVGKLIALKEEIEAKQIEKKKLRETESLVKFLRDRIFNKVSDSLSERYREEISLRADRIYRNIAETDEELEWGDQYSIVLRDMQDGKVRERTDDQLSGGQIMSSVVALRLALLQTIGARIAFFDEPTSNLDAARRENLAHAFRAIDVGREEVTEHWYDQLFLISHDVAFTEVTDQMISLE